MPPDMTELSVPEAPAQSPQRGFPRHLRDLYRALLFPRLIEEKMLLLLRQGRLSKWFSGIGQEAIAVGVTSALKADDWILPMHRNLGVFTGRGLDLVTLLRQLMGKDGGFTKGRERSFHFGVESAHIAGMISHLGAMLPVACGLGLAAQLRYRGRIAAAFTGDGHEDADRGLESAPCGSCPCCSSWRTTSTACPRSRRSSTPARTSPTAARATACRPRSSTATTFSPCTWP
jgi:TPP-dependent pyruvate/acetoin dehydrogenase alpha subunit